MKKIIFLFLVLQIFSLESYSQMVTQEWVRSYSSGTTESTHPRYMSLDSAGNIIIAGFGFEGMNLIKYNPQGDLLWARRYMGNQGYLPQPSGLGVDKFNNIYMLGNAVSGLIIKYDANGNLLWEKAYPYKNGGGITDIEIDNEGNFYIAGGKSVGFVNTDLHISKFSPSGDTLWTYQYAVKNSYTGAYGMKLKLDDSNNVYSFGQCHRPSTYIDLIAVKVNNEGILLWDTVIDCNNGKGDYAISMDIDKYGNVYLLSDVVPTQNNNVDIGIIKINNDGSFGWKILFDGTANSSDRGKKIINRDSIIYIAGRTAEPPPEGDQYLILKYDLTGNEIWNKNYGSTGIFGDEPKDIVIDANENLYITGSSFVGSFNNWCEYLTYKIDSSGYIIWEKKFMVDRRINSANSIVLDENKNVYVTGSSSVNGRFSIYTLKYSQIVNVITSKVEVKDFKLYQNYPNPFNPLTTITFSLPHSGRVQLNIYNALGQLVSTPVSEHKQPGTYSVTFDASDLPSGVYFYRIQAGSFVDTKRFVLLK